MTDGDDGSDLSDSNGGPCGAGLPANGAEAVDVEAPRLVETDDRLLLRWAGLELSFSQENGALREVRNTAMELSFSLTEPESPPMEWTVGGRERRRPPQAALRYEGTRTRGSGLELDDVELLKRGAEVRIRTVASSDDWRLVCTYSVERDETRVEFAFDLTYVGDREEVRLRRTRVPFDVPLTGSGWRLDVPGAPLPPSVSLDDLDDGTVLEWGPRRIHAGLSGLHVPEEDGGLATWTFSRDWPVELTVAVQDETSTAESTEADTRTPEDPTHWVSTEYELWTAARLSPGEGVTFESLWLAPFADGWQQWLASFEDWWDAVGLETPLDSPDWIEGAAIFEVHVGTAKFRDGFEYAPYPTVEDLLADLPRVAALGFDAVQLMPRHPYPSYVVVDGDETAWGDPDELERFVEAAHGVGLRVVLDVVLHGVLDRDVLEKTSDSIAEHGLLDGSPDKVAQYVEDHGDDWWEHLPGRNRLVRDHPDWFVRDDDGEIAHRYTHALDLANPAVQSYFVERLTTLVDDVGVDGFRLDAPTWNMFPNWDADLGYPAGHVPLGAVGLFRQLRQRLRDEHPDVALYVEAAGPLFRESSDVNYNYDEMWLLDAVFGGETTRFRAAVPDEIAADEVAEWLARRDDALPAGSTTAHHVDSHDTFWWPDPGEKWFRERYGEGAAAAAIVLFATLDGAFMSYVGAERGQEALLRRVLELREQLPEIADGECDLRGVECDDSSIFAALRHRGSDQSIVAVNTSNRQLSASLAALEESGDGEAAVHDALEEELIATEVSPGSAIEVPFEPYQPRLLVFRCECERSE